ncbi:MAG TPA: hypothetical protein VFY29_13350 [Terriglobia bacterium]|nr:hypothetical protein [Terriglobia bacterium]
MSARPSARRGWLVFVVWAAVAFFYFAISWDYIRTSHNDRQFVDYMEYVAQIVGEERRPVQDARTLLEVKARELGLPIKSNEIVILGGGPSLSISVGYEVDIHVPILDRGIYRKLYQHRVNYKPLR